MPELPDLQAFSHTLNKKIKGKKLREVKLLNKGKLNVSVQKLKKSIEGSRLSSVYREGKELHFAFSNGNILGLHLMLHGRLFLFIDRNEEKHTILELIFNDNSGLALTDYQKQARPTLNPEEASAPDALSKEMNAAYLKEQLSKKKTNIKKFLMDQDIIRGIGNAYADEILWKAGISPLSVCNKIPPGKISLLARSIKSVLKQAEKKILKAEPGIISGEVRDFLAIHNAKKKKSPTGKPIRHQMINSRITYFTGEQKLYR